MELIHNTRNGNYWFSLYKDGTKIRYTQDDYFKSEFPESLDMKITNYCDLGCPYCHENSSIKGKHADAKDIINVLSCLPGGIELAIGGGNPLAYPNLIELCDVLNCMGFIPNITVNSKHLFDLEYFTLVKELIAKKLIYGLGISYDKKCSKPFDYSNAVCHLIAGIHTIEDIKKALDMYKKILILGYKSFRKGHEYYENNFLQILNNIEEIRDELPNLLDTNIGVILFDNLGIKQLDVKSAISKYDYEEFYMGDDGDYTMYYDAVNKEFAKSSVSQDRKKSKDMSILEFFTS